MGGLGSEEQLREVKQRQTTPSPEETPDGGKRLAIVGGRPSEGSAVALVAYPGGGTRPLEGSSVVLVAYPGGGTRPLEGSSVVLMAYPGGGTRPSEGSSVALVAYPGEVQGRWRAVL